MRTRTGVLLGAAVLGMGWAVSKSRSPAPSLTDREIKIETEVPFARPKTETMKDEQVEKTTRTPQAFTPPTKQWPEKPFQYQQDLDSFSKLRAKVFLS